MSEHDDWYEEQGWGEHYKGVWEAAKRWRLLWPAHCRTCRGWGGYSWSENHGIPGPGENMFELCQNCVGAEEPRCGRCSFPMTLEQAEASEPCVACGWDTDDGEPQL